MKLRMVLLGTMMVFILAASAEAAKVCIEHNGMFLLINEEAQAMHEEHGDQVVSADNCIDTCLDHKGQFINVAADEVQAHLDHGDTEVDPEQCL